MSGVAADLEVGDEDAADGDGDEADRCDDVEAPVDGVAPAEARENARRTRAPPMRPPTWPPIEMLFEREAERQVEDDDDERGAAEDVDVAALEDEARAEDAENGSRGADRRRCRA